MKIIFSVLLLFTIKKFDSNHLTTVFIPTTCSFLRYSKFGLECKSAVSSAYNVDVQSILQAKSFIAMIHQNGSSTDPNGTRV